MSDVCPGCGKIHVALDSLDRLQKVSKAIEGTSKAVMIEVDARRKHGALKKLSDKDYVRLGVAAAFAELNRQIPAIVQSQGQAEFVHIAPVLAEEFTHMFYEMLDKAQGSH